MLRVLSIWMPGFTRVIAAKLFQTSPAQTKSTSVSAICVTTSAPRSRTDCRPAEPLLPSRNESMASTLVAQWTQIKVPAFVEFRIALHQPGRDRRKLRLSGGNRKAGLEPAEHSPKTRVGHGVLAALIRKNSPERRDVERVFERARHDAD